MAACTPLAADLPSYAFERQWSSPGFLPPTMAHHLLHSNRTSDPSSPCSCAGTLCLSARLPMSARGWDRGSMRAHLHCEERGARQRQQRDSHTRAQPIGQLPQLRLLAAAQSRPQIREERQQPLMHRVMTAFLRVSLGGPRPEKSSTRQRWVYTAIARTAVWSEQAARDAPPTGRGGRGWCRAAAGRARTSPAAPFVARHRAPLSPWPPLWRVPAHAHRPPPANPINAQTLEVRYARGSARALPQPAVTCPAHRLEPLSRSLWVRIVPRTPPGPWSFRCKDVPLGAHLRLL